MAKKQTSTDEVRPGKFRPHGRIDFQVEGHILLAHAIGPFNTELIEAVTQVDHALLRPLIKSGHWGELIVFQQSAMGSQHTLSLFTQHLQRFVANGYNGTAVALIMGAEVDGRHVMAPLIAGAYTQAGIRNAVFDNVQEGRDWLEAQIQAGKP